MTVFYSYKSCEPYRQNKSHVLWLFSFYVLFIFLKFISTAVTKTRNFCRLHAD